MPQNVTVQIICLMTELLNVNNVLTNVLLVLVMLITVLIVLKTEKMHLIVHVHFLMDIITLKDKLSVHLVLTDVKNVPRLKPVSFVPPEELMNHHTVHVQKINMKTLTTNVNLVISNVNIVLIMMNVPTVPETE